MSQTSNNSPIRTLRLPFEELAASPKKKAEPAATRPLKIDDKGFLTSTYGNGREVPVARPK